MQLPLIPNESLNLDDSSSFAMAYGTSLHEAIEYLPHRLWSPSDLEGYDGGVQKKLTTYNQNPLTQSLYQGYTLHNELTYLVKDTDGVSNGIMDLVAINDTDLVLVDFKTDNASEAEIRIRYVDQIARYQHALSILYPDHHTLSYIYSFALNAYLPF